MPQIISEGTLRPEDLIPRFAAALRTATWPDAEGDVRFLADLLTDAEGWPENKLFTSIILEDLERALSWCAPEGHYFGTAEGDGACFGWWEEESEEPPANGSRQPT